MNPSLFLTQCSWFYSCIWILTFLPPHPLVIAASCQLLLTAGDLQMALTIGHLSLSHCIFSPTCIFRSSQCIYYLPTLMLLVLNLLEWLQDHSYASWSSLSGSRVPGFLTTASFRTRWPPSYWLNSDFLSAPHFVLLFLLHPMCVLTTEVLVLYVWNNETQEKQAGFVSMLTRFTARALSTSTNIQGTWRVKNINWPVWLKVLIA